MFTARVLDLPLPPPKDLQLISTKSKQSEISLLARPLPCIRERESLFIRFLPYVMALAPITLIAVDRYAQFVHKIAKFLAIVQGLHFIFLYRLWFDTRSRLIFKRFGPLIILAL